MEDLSLRRLEGIYYGYHQVDRQAWLHSWYLIEAREEDVQVRPGDRWKICRRRESAGVVFAVSPVIGVGGKASSPSTPAGWEDLSKFVIGRWSQRVPFRCHCQKI